MTDVTERLKEALQPDYVVLGGGNIASSRNCRPAARPGDNANAFKGGFRLWEEPAQASPATPATAGNQFVYPFKDRAA